MRALPKLAALLAVSVLGLLDTGTIEAGPATDQLHARVDEVLKVLADPEMAKEARIADRRAALRRIAGEIFDFAEISRRSLARHWQARSPAEQQEFVRLFGDLLERAYISKIETYSGEKIEYPGEVVDGDVITVRTRIISKQGTAIPVDYRMFQQSGNWRAYDALIEGVSLVANYRSQFNSVIQRSSYGDLVKTLRAKSQEAAPAGPGKVMPTGGAAGAPGRRPETP